MIKDDFLTCPESIRLLAEVERDMDDDKIPFVMHNGTRVAVREETMSDLGLKKGQTVSDFILSAIFKAAVAGAATSLAIHKAKDATNVTQDKTNENDAAA